MGLVFRHVPAIICLFLCEAFYYMKRKCAHCGEVKHWRRFRVSLGGGRMRDEAMCSKCRRYAKKPVLNRTDPELVRQIKTIRSYASRRTAWDRKYLRDVTKYGLSDQQFQRDQQQIAITRANGWINFYSDISNHAINILQETGTHPHLHKLEADPHLQKLYGVYDTKRAQRLRYLGELWRLSNNERLSCI